MPAFVGAGPLDGEPRLRIAVVFADRFDASALKLQSESYMLG
jgi:hypothetical protein